MLKNTIFLLCILGVLQSRAIVGGVTSTDPLPTYLNEVDRQTLKSHTVVLINTENPSQHSRCTGTLIAPKVILTAAHCISADLQNLWVVPSIYEFAISARKPVERVFVHPEYQSFDIPKLNKPNNDLALVQFSGDLPDGYKPASWLASFTPQIDSFWLYTAGYGVSSETADDFGELRFGRVTIENDLFLQNQSFMTGNQHGGEGICKGDSGGPVFLKNGSEFQIVGVVSAITGSCRGTSYFNRTSFYNDWIQRFLKH